MLGHVGLYITVYMAVAFCAVLCGLGPSILTAMIGLGGILYWFVDLRSPLSVLHQSEIQSITGFVLACAVLIALGEANRGKQLKLNQTVAALTMEANERKSVEEKLRQAHDLLEQRIRERTAELTQALVRLESEVKVRIQAEDQLRALTVRLMTLQDQERRRIARELHDTTGQTLAAIKMTMAALTQSASQMPQAAELLEELNKLTDQAVQDVRTTSYLLHPPLLDEAGFASAALWFVEGFAQRSGIRVRCDLPEKAARLPKDCELALFRILQESLTNVHRYSGASNVTIALNLDNSQLRFEVADDGRGIHPDRLQRLQHSDGGAGVGIAGMKERVRELGGKLSIRSGQDGTTVCVSLPMSRESESGRNEGVPAA